MSKNNEITDDDFNNQNEKSNNSFAFSAEPSKSKNYQKVIVAVVMFFAILGGIMGVFYLAKSKINEWRADKEQERLELRSQSGSGNRRGKVFSEIENEPAPAALPTQFNAPPQQLSTPPIAVLNEPRGQKKSAEPAPERPPAFAFPEKKKTSYSSVQEYANESLQGQAPTQTGQATAAKLGDRSMVLARGAQIPCVLETQLISHIQGQTSCIISQNIYSDNGSRLLIPRGSSAIGSYGNMQVGDQRIAVLWDRIKTTDGVVIDVDSGAADGVGTMGVGGHVDNHWGSRIGAAMLLSLIDDAVDIVVAKQSSGDTFGQSTSRSSKSLAEKILDSTINIKPTLSANRGSRLMIYVSKDLWFDGVYEE